MSRYLSPSQISAAIQSGRSVEQFLRSAADRDVLTWLELRAAKDEMVEVRAFKVENIGSAEWLDLYSFPRLDESDERPRITLPMGQALAYCSSKFGADQSLWVNGSVV
jgi:hypothetical protein